MGSAGPRLKLATTLFLLIAWGRTAQADDEPAPLPKSWCAHVAGGPPGERDPAVDLSAAHAGARFFGVSPRYRVVDQALGEALDAHDPFSLERLMVYADSLEGVCASEADARELGPAEISMVDSVALVQPGTGDVVLPPETAGVAIDLRDLPSASGLQAALENAVAPALKESVESATRHLRGHLGMTDEVFAAQNVYSNQVINVTPGPIRGRGDRELPLAFIVGPKLAPEAAELAGTLRVSGRAWLIGDDVWTAVAESHQQGIGETSLSYRTADLFAFSQRWPDVIPADFQSDDPLELLPKLPSWGMPGPLQPGKDLRASIGVVTPFGDIHPSTWRAGYVRSALITAHGAVRLFFPYFHVVGDGIDERLVERLKELDRTPVYDRRMVRDWLRRFGQVIHDGHNFVYNYAGPTPAGYFPVVIEPLDGRPVVVRSLADEVHPGDMLVSIDGEPIEEWYSREFERTAGATDGYRFDLATREYITMYGPRSFGVMDPDGKTRTELVHPYPLETFLRLGSAPSLRPSGPLADYGAPQTFFLNMASEVTSTVEAFREALSKAAGAKGLVVDMRGYPGFNHYEADQRIINERFSSPFFLIPRLSGPDFQDIFEVRNFYDPLTNPSYDGPVVLLVGPRTVSAAENFSIMLVGAERVTVVGRSSAGTNGNITGIQLPGAFSFTFTGMEVLFPDRSQFHGIGIIPDMEVHPSSSDFRDGYDREIAAAVEVLGG